VVDGDLIGASRIEIVEELAHKLLGALKSVAQRSTHRQVLVQRFTQAAHRTAPGHGRAICLSASRSTFA
jgi:hypothetical protein